MTTFFDGYPTDTDLAELAEEGTRHLVIDSLGIVLKIPADMAVSFVKKSLSEHPKFAVTRGGKNVRMFSTRCPASARRETLEHEVIPSLQSEYGAEIVAIFPLEIPRGGVAEHPVQHCHRARCA